MMVTLPAGQSLRSSLFLPAGSVDDGLVDVFATGGCFSFSPRSCVCHIIWLEEFRF